ncbi:MAG TPA: hypothetical protein DCO79_07070, partial [Spirochaeta sp.]|nr:hypothetical protein [Spirochaeta sp.]
DRLMRKSSAQAKPVIGMQMHADSVISVIKARGGSILKPAGFTYSLNNPVVNRTLRYLRNLEVDGILSVNSTNYLNQTMFAFGKLTAVYTQTDGIPYYAELTAMTNPQLDWEVALLPSRKPGDGTVIDCSCSAAVMRGQAEKELASWLFIKWLIGDAQQKKLAALTSSLPVTLSSAAAILAQESDIYTPRWIDALRLVDKGYKELIPSLSDYNEVSEAFDSMLERIREGEWVWLETLKLDWDVKKMRREEHKIRAGRK